MPENESLDIRLSPRWQFVLKKFLAGEPTGQLSRRFLVTLQTALQKAQQQMAKHGTSLQEAIETALAMGDFTNLIRKTRGHDYIRLFEVEQRIFDTPEALVHRVVLASCDRVLDQ